MINDDWEDIREHCRICDDLRYMHYMMQKPINFIVGGRGAGRSYYMEDKVNKDVHKKAENIANKLTFEEKLQICIVCKRYGICGDLYNGKCPMMIKEIEDALKRVEEKKEKGELKDKVIQFPVDMDEMQKNILISLLNARKEATDQNILTVHGFVAIIDALYYLIKSGDMDNLNGSNGREVKCLATGGSCSYCTQGPCDHRLE